MNRSFWVPIVGALLCFSSPNNAAADEHLAETLALCTACHGVAGLPTSKDIPILWGQEFYYLYVQLKDYKAGRRANEIMSGIVADLDKKTMQELAQHFSEQSWPGTGYRAAEDEENKALTALGAGQCVQCHLGGYEGNSRIPRMAGQQAEYLERTMLEFKTKVRLNSAAKGTLLAAYSDDDIAVMAHYLAGL
ncbi:MAG: c-type cytochrome [Alphaproteobacteria bacterium]